jgi:hypothetical protein
VPPSSGYLAQVLEVLKKQPVKMIIHAAYEDWPALRLRRPARRRAGRDPALHHRRHDGAKDLYSLYDDTLNRMLKPCTDGYRRDRTQHPDPGVPRRPLGALHPRAAGPAGPGAWHRLHRPLDRPGGGPGVTIAGALGSDPKGWTVQVAATAAALVGALLLTWTDKKWPEVQEALIGVLFVAAASIELLLLANNPHGGEHLKDLLVGQILWVTLPSLIPIAVFYAAALAIWFRFRERLGQVGFYVLFALVVTQSVQLVGVYWCSPA